MLLCCALAAEAAATPPVYQRRFMLFQRQWTEAVETARTLATAGARQLLYCCVLFKLEYEDHVVCQLIMLGMRAAVPFTLASCSSEVIMHDVAALPERHETVTLIATISVMFPI